MLIFCFSNKVNNGDISTLCKHGNNINSITTFKLLGVLLVSIIRQLHMLFTSKSSKQMYCINYFVRMDVPL